MTEKQPVKRNALMRMVCALALILFASCDQSPLFYQISQEVEPKEPRIKGVPSNFAVFQNGLYVASSSLHRYAKNAAGSAVWDTIPKPSGRIYALAATDTFLYALTLDENEVSGLYKLGVGQTDWSGKIPIEEGDGTAFSSLQSIYAAGNTLFAGGWNGIATSALNATNYAIFYENNDKLKLIKANTGLLSGAVQPTPASTDYYLSTAGAGIYYLSGLTAALTGPLQNAAGGSESEIVGIINVGADIIAVTRNGIILKINNTTDFTAYPTGQRMTGAMTLWRNAAGEQLLLLGIQPGNGSTSTIYGYRERKIDGGNLDLNLNSEGKLDLQVPGDGAPSTVDNKDRYANTIGPHPVNHLIQAHIGIDPEMTLFAGLQGTGKSTNEIDSGVWSYRNRNGDWQWNAEE
ncbi:hypothetical protein FACS189476_05890 [Spirochaetia bacterium]|nr:hypothetical protein FACS189476_05890 [Spirochaetia bacterium]